jgi:hypothetical protein
MQGLQDDYLAAYRSLKLTRDSEGVLVAEFHSNDRPFTFTAQDHTEFVDAFYRIAQDRANKILILTGAGGEFIPYIDFSSFAQRRRSAGQQCHWNCQGKFGTCPGGEPFQLLSFQCSFRKHATCGLLRRECAIASNYPSLPEFPKHPPLG